ncbi:MAG TPA: hypothetical protein VLW85_03715 [Myxococcales bacterium]|nr:hypothetical protein [Myxococcales bacterium]
MTRALLCLALAACGGVDPDAPEEADVAAAPTAFVLQFTGTYSGGSTLVLGRDGGYKLDGARGHFRATGAGKSLPLTLAIGRRKAVIAAYDGKLRFGDEALQLERPAASDEDLCDSTGGKWTDDDADPATGLYCICPAATHFIPASGGCTT